MIPIRLELSNFLSYRQPTILDFRGIHLACISGANGAGKSSLLDAITWALFGQSRSKSDDDIVNRMAANMGQAAEVKFDFALEGTYYRVIRRKIAGKNLLLEFQVSTADGAWKVLSESRLRETQAAIENVLKMGYDTFTNASFLLQGKADEFTTKTANKRKEILADLLGVSEWDRYKEKATARRKDVENQLMVLDGRLQDIEAELSQEAERVAELSAASEALQRISEREAAQAQLLEHVRRTGEAIRHQEQGLKNLESRLTLEEAALLSARETYGRRQAERRHFQELTEQAEVIEGDYSAWQQADANSRSWQDKADVYHTLLQEKRPYELLVEREHSRLTQRKLELDEHSRRVTAMRREREEVTELLEQTKTEIDGLTARLEKLAGKENDLGEARIVYQQLETERKLFVQEFEQLSGRAVRIEDLREEKPAVAANLAEAHLALASVEAELAAVNEQQQHLMLAMADTDRLRAEQPELKQQMVEAKDRIERLNRETTGECPLCGQPLTENHRLSVLSELETRGKNLGDRFRGNSARIHDLSAEVELLTNQVKQKSRLERELQTQQQRKAGAQARLDEIDLAIAEWVSESAGRLIELEAKLADDAAIKNQQARVSELTAGLAGKGELETQFQQTQKQLSAHEARLVEIGRAILEWDGLEPERGGAPSSLALELATIGDLLESGQFALGAQANLARLDKQLSELGYDPAVHEAARQARDRLANAQETFQELQKAQAALKPLDDNLADLESQIAQGELRLQTSKDEKAEAVANLESMSAGKMDESIVEQELYRQRDAVITAHKRVAMAQQSVAVLDDLRQRKQRASSDRTQITQVIKRLTLLERSCGREGVQALLIERALPEIEMDANMLLDRLTGGQMQVIFETQRRLKTRDKVAETLDIRIADAAGERPYENFSGGEQFRVNFAIRLALSQILAKRAGARLQTLVIDEGFGSQDPEGRQRLVEAINTVRGDFERILVITHIDEMRDAFSNRIMIEKGANGSEISIL